MKDETFRAMYQDYLDYQGYYKSELDWEMEESFEEYVQRSIDNGELDQWADSNRFFSAEDSGMTDTQIVELIESQFWQDWTTSTTPVNPGWWNLTISVRDLKMWSRGIKANRNWKVSNVKKYFNIRGNKDSLVTQIEAIQSFINELQEGNADAVFRVREIIDEYFE
ncbi:MAG: hypothetical protein ACR2M9_04815 [Cyanophyceae cyanobacterium]